MRFSFRIRLENPGSRRFRTACCRIRIGLLRIELHRKLCFCQGSASLWLRFFHLVIQFLKEQVHRLILGNFRCHKRGCLFRLHGDVMRGHIYNIALGCRQLFHRIASGFQFPGFRITVLVRRQCCHLLFSLINAIFGAFQGVIAVPIGNRTICRGFTEFNVSVRHLIPTPHNRLASPSRNDKCPEGFRRSRKVLNGIRYFYCLINIILGSAVKSAGRCGIVCINISNHQMADHIRIIIRPTT